MKKEREKKPLERHTRIRLRIQRGIRLLRCVGLAVGWLRVRAGALFVERHWRQVVNSIRLPHVKHGADTCRKIAGDSRKKNQWRRRAIRGDVTDLKTPSHIIS